MTLVRSGLGTKVALTAAALGTAGAVAGLGTFGTFTSTTPATPGTYASGTVVLAFDTTTQANRLSVGASGLVPGDTVQRAFTLKNTGSQDFASVALSSTANPTSVLDTGADGLTVVLDRCSVAWTESVTTPYTYTCAGTTTTVLASGPVIRTSAALTGLSMVTAGSSDNLRMTLTLPGTADNTYQGKSSTVSYTFTATQRTGTSK